MTLCHPSLCTQLPKRKSATANGVVANASGVVARPCKFDVTKMGKLGGGGGGGPGARPVRVGEEEHPCRAKRHQAEGDLYTDQ